MNYAKLINDCSNALGLVRVDKPGIRPDTFGAVMPFIAMDAHYCEWHDVVDCRKWKFNLKKLKSNWQDAYNTLDQAFFRKLDEETTYDMVTLFDDFSDYVREQANQLKSELLSCIRQEMKQEDKDVICGVYCAYIFANIANVFYRRTYRSVEPVAPNKLRVDMVFTEKESSEILSCAKWSEAFLQEFGKMVCGEPIKISDEVHEMSALLARRCVNWQKEMDKKIKA